MLYNITFLDVLAFPLRYRDKVDAMSNVPYECVGYLVFGTNLTKLRMNLTLE